MVGRTLTCLMHAYRQLIRVDEDIYLAMGFFSCGFGCLFGSADML
jgi:hypothetical protein